MHILRTVSRFLAIALFAVFAVSCDHQKPASEPVELGSACMICGNHEIQLPHDTVMQCSICLQTDTGARTCSEGHFVCRQCLSTGMEDVMNLCLADTSSDPIDVFENLVSQPYCTMHGPIHHVLVGASLLTAYHNAGGKVDLRAGLVRLMQQGKKVPGAACGNWGTCGAAISAGIFMSIITENSPFATDAWRLSNLLTAKALEQVALNGGPRCCKRDSYLSILTTVDFVRENLGVAMGKPVVKCSRSEMNEQCIGKKCPFSSLK